MRKLTAQQLLIKYQAGKCSEKELAIIETWLMHFNANETSLPVGELEAALNRVQLALPVKVAIVKQIAIWKRIAVAASVIFCIVLSAYLILTPQISHQLANNRKNDILPASNKAFLTLSNGVKIVLGNVNAGTIAVQGNARVIKTENGLITYNNTGGNNQAPVYNTLTVPRGAHYDVTLSDGTKVWLNAESSITYPVVFTGEERDVTIDGEAYFEVAKNKEMPFHVNSGGQTIEVLGTHFNVNAYDNEDAIKTTLLEGSVKVTRGLENVILTPGEQSVNRKANEHLIVKNADPGEAVAWKDGLFSFRNADLKTVMRQIARWYDVEIRYEGNIPPREFSGKIHRNNNASQVLEILSYTNIHFTIKKNTGVGSNKTIVVTP